MNSTCLLSWKNGHTKPLISFNKDLWVIFLPYIQDTQRTPACYYDNGVFLEELYKLTMQQGLGAQLHHMYGEIKFKNFYVNILGILLQEAFWRKWLSSSTPLCHKKFKMTTWLMKF